MKYTVIAEIADGIICATKNEITCVISNSLRDDEDVGVSPNIGDVLHLKMVKRAEHYWSYSRKEWAKLDEAFTKIQN